MNSHPAHIVPIWKFVLFVTGFLVVVLLTNCQTEPENVVETAVPTVAIVPTPTPEASNTIEPKSKLAQALQNILDHAVSDGAPGAALMVNEPSSHFVSMMLDVMSAIQEYANKRFIMGDGRC